MTQNEVVKAYLAAKRLNSQPFPGQTAMKIFMLVKKLQPTIDFQIQEENKIWAKYPDFVPELNGCRTTGSSKEEIDKARSIAKAVDDELTQLGNLEVSDLNIEPFSITENELASIQISGEDIGYLMPFISFK